MNTFIYFLSTEHLSPHSKTYEDFSIMIATQIPLYVRLFNVVVVNSVTDELIDVFGGDN